jgi:ubiquinone/menaquinone biosynthesis C-methylase UbiE
METTIITAPSAELRVQDMGQTRRIFVNGLAVHKGRKQKVFETVDTPLSVSTLESLVKIKGDWWLDELERRTDRSYVRRRLETLVGRFETLSGTRILDVGSGCGSSALCLTDAGANYVQGVEPNPSFVDLANRRTQDEGLSDKISFLSLTNTTKLPFDSDRFDIVTFNAVLEHIDPKLRAPILQEAYRCLKPGGLLVMTETPNSLFPYDGHTTHLPLIPWLPLNWAVALAKRFSLNSPRGLTKEQYVAEGIVGVTYWQIQKALPQAYCLNLTGGDADWKSQLRRSSVVTHFVLIAFEKFFRFFKIPLASVLPSLDLVFRKP